MSSSFWALRLTKGIQYIRTVHHSFKITGASLDLVNSCIGDGVTTLIFEEDGIENVVCNLSAKQNIFQVPLDLLFNKGDRINFSVKGAEGNVFLIGYKITNTEQEDEPIEISEERLIDAKKRSVSFKESTEQEREYKK